jgi:DNA invertase Pin-like site-specific DNA recombinase
VKHRVIGYCRVSTDGQADSGAGLAAQRTAIEQECKLRGWNLLRIAKDTGSGKSITGRKALLKALDDLDAGHADGIIASKLDRLSRSVQDFCSVLERSTKKGWSVTVLDVAVDTSSPSGELLATVVSAFAQYERRLIGQRTKDALSARRAAGVRLGRPRSLDPVVRERIVSERAEGRSFAAIADDLNDEGVGTAQGGARWHPSSVRAVASSA